MIQIKQHGCIYSLTETEIFDHLPEEVLEKALKRGKAIKRHKEIAKRGYRAIDGAEAKRDRMIGRG